MELLLDEEELLALLIGECVRAFEEWDIPAFDEFFESFRIQQAIPEDSGKIPWMREEEVLDRKPRWKPELNGLHGLSEDYFYFRESRDGRTDVFRSDREVLFAERVAANHLRDMEILCDSKVFIRDDAVLLPLIVQLCHRIDEQRVDEDLGRRHLESEIEGPEEICEILVRESQDDIEGESHSDSLEAIDHATEHRRIESPAGLFVGNKRNALDTDLHIRHEHFRKLQKDFGGQCLISGGYLRSESVSSEELKKRIETIKIRRDEAIVVEIDSLVSEIRKALQILSHQIERELPDSGVLRSPITVCAAESAPPPG